MRYKTLFRLGLKLIGVYLFFVGLQAIIFGLLSAVVQVYFLQAGAMPQWDWWTWVAPISGVFNLLMGMYLFFRGRWIVDLAIPSNRPYCPQCAYDLQGAVSGRCPECGTPFRVEDVAPPSKTSES